MANERTPLYLQPETKQALKDYAERTKAESVSAAADELIQRGLTATSARNMDELAVPAIEEAVGRRLTDDLKEAMRPLWDELRELRVAVRAVHKEAAIGRLEGFAHIGNDYGLDEARKIEGAAEGHAERALESGEVARMHVRVA